MVDPQQTFNMHPIGVIHTPYGEKFAVPRQPRLVESTHCTIELFAPYCDPQACIGLEGFSHIHVLFVFDQIPEDKFRPMISVWVSLPRARLFALIELASRF